MIIKTSKSFIKAFDKCDKLIQEKIISRLDLFLKNPQSPLLNFHKLQGKLNDVWSINVTGDYRIWLQINSEECILLLVGTHSQLY